MSTVFNGFPDESSVETVECRRVAYAVDVFPWWVEVTMTFSYQNRDISAVEAICTFPVPFGAVISGIDAQWGGKHYHAVVIERTQASAEYEEAVEKGKAAVVVETDGDGLYRLTIGQLAPQQSADITVRYAQWVKPVDRRWSLTLPTTVGDRYGVPTSPLSVSNDVHHQGDLDRRFQFDLSLPQEWRDVALRCTTHTLVSNNTSRWSLESTARADGDLVVTFEGIPVVDECLQFQLDENHWIVARCDLPNSSVLPSQTHVKIVLDCSGSMNGHRIKSAKRTVLAILNALNEQDSFSLTEFGSDVFHHHEHMVFASREQRLHSQRRLRRVEANRGGTELYTALRSTLELRSGDAQADVLLITDGDVNNVAEIIQLAQHSAQRISVIAIGASPNDHLLQSIARASGGVYCRVGEVVESETIAPLLTALRTPQLSNVAITWPLNAVTQHAVKTTQRAGHSVMALVQMPAPTSECELSCQYQRGDDRTNVKLPVTLEAQPRRSLTALCATLLWHETQGKNARKNIALRHQLLTPDTAAFMLIREAGTQVEPEAMKTVIVPQCLPRDRFFDAPTMYRRSFSAGGLCESTVSYESRMITVAELNQSQLSALNKRLKSQKIDALLCIEVLRDIGCDVWFLEELEARVAAGEDEAAVVKAIILFALQQQTRWRFRTLRKVLGVA